MKKGIFLLIALLALGLLSACSNTTKDIPSETTAETASQTEGIPSTDTPEQPIRLSDAEKAKYFNFIEFDLPEGNFRDALVEHMRKQASIKWVCSSDFGVNEQFSHWGIALQYKKGQTYYGIVYSDYKISCQQFTDLLVDGTYTNSSDDWKTVPGVGCYSSILNSIQQFEKTDGYTDIFMPGHKDFLLQTVGGYKIPEVVRRTQDICEANGADGMYLAYTELKKGDIIFTKDYYEKGNSVHCRVVVEEPTIVRNGSGNPIPSRCSVKTIEATNQFDKTRKDGVNTTWYVDHVYSFQDLYTKFYVPLTLESYTKPLSEMEVPYLLLDSEITPSVLGKGAYSSSVKSNFPLRFVEAKILDKNGNVVAEAIKGDMHTTYSIPLRNYFTSLFDDLEKGTEYTFVLKAGISRGSAELARVDFTYNK